MDARGDRNQLRPPPAPRLPGHLIRLGASQREESLDLLACSFCLSEATTQGVTEDRL
jgi:hypothetical protein